MQFSGIRIDSTSNRSTYLYSCFAVYISSKAAIFALLPSANAFEGKNNIQFH